MRMEIRFDSAPCQPRTPARSWLPLGALLLVLVRPAFGAPAVLDEVEFLADGMPAVRLRLSAETPVQAQALAPEGGSPARVYVDLAGTRLKPGTPRVIAGAGVVQRVRVGQFEPGTTRVVIDLRRTLPFALRSAGGTVTIQLDPRSPTAGTGPIHSIPAYRLPQQQPPLPST